MRLIALLALLGGCAWTPEVMSYPKPGNGLGGLQIIRGDHRLLDGICSRVDDKGNAFAPNEYAAGCYDQAHDTIYLLDDCEGAEALPHELGHREGIEDPEAAGLNW